MTVSTWKVSVETITPTQQKPQTRKQTSTTAGHRKQGETESRKDGTTSLKQPKFQFQCVHRNAVQLSWHKTETTQSAKMLPDFLR